MTVSEPNKNFFKLNLCRSGARHWFRITGLPGWKRARAGMPAFGRPGCGSRQGGFVGTGWLRRTLFLVKSHFCRTGQPELKSHPPHHK